MAEDLRRLDRWVRKDDWPSIACPVCQVGHLSVESLNGILSAASHRYYRFEADPDPWALNGIFHGILRCAIPTCGEPVVVAGDLVTDIDVDDDGASIFVEKYRLRFATPALRLMAPPAKTPVSVTKAINSAAEILWADPSSAANRLRVAIEELLTAHRIRKFTETKPPTAAKVQKRKRQRLSTHDRIEKFKARKPLAAETLMAVKFIGNSGSHESSMTATEVMESADLLLHALRLLYDKTDEEMQRRARRIVKQRGLPRRR